MAVKLVVEPIYEADFESDSYGFRPKRNAHQALSEVRQCIVEGMNWVIDADVKAYLDVSSYCTPICCKAVKEARHRLRKLDSQAFSASVLDVNRVKLAALYTLQDGLTADAQSERGLEHRDVAGRRLIDKSRAELIRDANSPRSAGCELLADDEAVVQPAMNRRRGDAENFGGAIDGDHLSAW